MKDIQILELLKKDIQLEENKKMPGYIIRNVINEYCIIFSKKLNKLVLSKTEFAKENELNILYKGTKEKCISYIDKHQEGFKKV